MATAEQRGVRDAAAAVPERTAALVASIADPMRRPTPEDWSAHEVVLHLAATDLLWHERLDRLANEDHPEWPWVEPPKWDGPGHETIEGALAAFTGFRGETIARLDALDDAGWARRGHHRTFGELDAAGLMRVLLDHDEEHLAQIRAV